MRISIFEKYGDEENPPAGTSEHKRIVATPTGAKITIKSTRPISEELGNKFLWAITSRNCTNPALKNPLINRKTQTENPQPMPMSENHPLNNQPQTPVGMERVNSPMPLIPHAAVIMPNFHRHQLALEYHPVETVVVPERVANFVNQPPINNLQQIMNYLNNPLIPRPFGTYQLALEYHPPHP